MLELPVLIVGGGPVGITASTYLSHFGISVLHRSVESAAKSCRSSSRPNGP